MAVSVICGPLIQRAAPSLTPAMDITNSGPRATFWELWDGRKANAPAVAKYSTNAGGTFLGGAILTSPRGTIEVLTMPLDDFLAELRRIEAS